MFFDTATTDPMSMYYMKKLYMITILLVLVGGINWLSVGLFQKDLVVAALGKGMLPRVVQIAVGVAALLLIARRDTYLPFLGQTLVPAGALTTKSPQGANQVIPLRTVPGAKVIYWATEPKQGDESTALNTWEKAQKGQENSGVAVADESGQVALKIRGEPQPQQVPFKGRLEPHIHFRVAEPNGMLGRVQTLFLKNGAVEGFADLL